MWIRLTEDKICSGSEQSLSECKERNLWIHDHRCAHAEDVAVTCESNAPDTYTEEITDYLDIDGLRTGFEEPDETTQSPEFEMISNEATISGDLLLIALSTTKRTRIKIILIFPCNV